MRNRPWRTTYGHSTGSEVHVGTEIRQTTRAYSKRVQSTCVIDGGEGRRKAPGDRRGIHPGELHDRIFRGIH